MQSLWSRAAQAHLCTCRTCAHVAIRRTTTAGPRRRPNLSEVFTAFYTTILGTAAVLDATYKDGRRKDLDRKIEDQRRSLAQLREASSLSSAAAIRSRTQQDDVDYLIQQLQEQQQDDVEFLPPAVMRQEVPLNAIDALKSICKTDDALTRHAESKRDLYIFLRTMHRWYDPDERLGIRYAAYLGPSLDSVVQAVDEEAAEGGAAGSRLLRARIPLSHAQFEQYHAMINRMVDKLIKQSYFDEIPWDPERTRRNYESLDSAWTAIRMLRSEGYPRYNHPSVDEAAARQAHEHLAGVIRQLFEDWNKDKQKAKPKFQVAKICYNMLVSPYPPTIHHYNMLLIGFTLKNAHNLTDIVVESLLEDSRLRPTPQTIVCLLLHYRRKRDIHGFYSIIRRMMALDNRGMLIRRKWYEDVVKIPGLHGWANLPEVTTSLKANWVIERPERDQNIYETLVSSLLGFGRVKDAVKVFIGSLQERLGTSVELFIYLVNQCMYRLDAPAAEIMLRGLIDNAGVMALLILRSNCPRRLAEHIYPILNMGKPPTWPFSQQRAQVMWYSKTMGPAPEDWGKIRLLTTAMFIRQSETHLSRLRHIFRRIGRLMAVDLPEARTHIAHCGIGELNSLMRHHEYVAARLLKHQGLLKVARKLEAKTWDLKPGNIAELHGRVSFALEESFPRLAVKADGMAADARPEMREITDHWIRYRISRIEGARGDAKWLMAHVELELLLGKRLQWDTHRRIGLVTGDEALEFRSLDLGVTPSEEEEPMDGEEVAERPQPDGTGLLPRTDALWAGRAAPAVRVG